MRESGDVHVEQHHQPNQSPNNKEGRTDDAIAATKCEPASTLASMIIPPEEHFHKVKVTEEAAIHAATRHNLH